MTEQERITKLEVVVDEHEKKLNNLDSLTKSVSELAFGIKKVSEDIDEIKVDMKDYKDKVEDIENKPAKLSLDLWIKLGGFIAAALLGYFFNVVVNTI